MELLYINTAINKKSGCKLEKKDPDEIFSSEQTYVLKTKFGQLFGIIFAWHGLSLDVMTYDLVIIIIIIHYHLALSRF